MLIYEHMIDKKVENFSNLMKEFRKAFTGPSSDLIKYLVTNKIMTPTDIAKQMGISRENLYSKYINS